MTDKVSFQVSTNSTSQPIPILPPPPAPLSLGPSRARRQLAARLAAQKQQAAETAEAEGDDERPGASEDRDSQWPTNPFVIAGVDDDGEGGNSVFRNSDFPPNADETSPTFPVSGFSPSDSLSTTSSDEEAEGHSDAMQPQARVPLEVEDDDEMGEMIGPSVSGMIDSDDEDEAIINESLGYSNLPAQTRYGGYGRSQDPGSHFDDEQTDSSDGEDEGLVEILVPGRKSSNSN